MNESSPVDRPVEHILKKYIYVNRHDKQVDKNNLRMHVGLQYVYSGLQPFIRHRCLFSAVVLRLHLG